MDKIKCVLNKKTLKETKWEWVNSEESVNLAPLLNLLYELINDKGENKDE